MAWRNPLHTNEQTLLTLDSFGGVYLTAHQRHGSDLSTLLFKTPSCRPQRIARVATHERYLSVIFDVIRKQVARTSSVCILRISHLCMLTSPKYNTFSREFVALLRLPVYFVSSKWHSIELCLLPALYLLEAPDFDFGF